ncbi:uncharacterized protein ATNIH1004_011416 [Aspergillus tanneri]|uniref:Carrier domain-containing protein n=1 Tax=Aspergillus tanneri TaxID=1220188 RepID=A0A5M9M6V1_9EURO|nr:uncharacterized protein ATNIH1004_011416 [Aspergillus tanneri]KAA8642471.1 hypothetical protein ATNIH1004_011416 [Aspergillus tanneri]
MYIEFAAQSSLLLSSKFDNSHFSPHAERLSISSPLGLGADLFVCLIPVTLGIRDFTIFGTSSFDQAEHGKGRVGLVSPGDIVAETRLKLLQKVARSSSMDSIIHSPAATSITGGGGFVDLPSVPNCSAEKSPFVDPLIWIIFFRLLGYMSIVILTPSVVGSKVGLQNWTVYSHHENISKGSLTNDIFIYDSSKILVAAIMRATFRSVPFKPLACSLTRLSHTASVMDRGKDDMELLAGSGYETRLAIPPTEEEDESSLETTSPPGDNTQIAQRSENPNDNNTLQQLRELLSNIMEISMEEIGPTSSLGELEINSLLVTQFLFEIQKRFEAPITSTQGKFKDPTRPPFLASTNGHTDDAKPVYKKHTKMTGFAWFYCEPYFIQSEVIVQYVVDAFTTLGCVLENTASGDYVPIIPQVDSQRKLIPQLYKILEDTRLITQKEDGRFQRSITPTLSTPASSLHSILLDSLPKHASEIKLFYTTGHKLADCLSGSADTLSLIFRDSPLRPVLWTMWVISGCSQISQKGLKAQQPMSLTKVSGLLCMRKLSHGIMSRLRNER